MKIKFISAALVLCVTQFCSPGHGQQATPDSLASVRNIAGCWRGGRIDFLPGLYEELRLVSRKPDGSLALTFIMELGPGGRIWDYDIPIAIEPFGFSWTAHTAALDATGDTMNVVKEWQGERSIWRFVRDRSADSLAQALQAAVGGVYSYTVPRELQDGWGTAEPEQEGFDRRKLTLFMESIAAGKQGDIHSIIITRHGRLVLEEYFTSSGKRFGGFHTEYYRRKPHRLASVTKGILSLLTGMAIDQGNITGTDARIWSWLQEYTDCMTPEKEDITIGNLLTMTAGLDWNQRQYSFWDPRNHAGQMYSSDDVPGHVLGLPLTGTPGNTFCYSNGLPVVLASILKNSVGTDVDAFAETYLFHPLGITDYKWSRYPDGSLEADGGLALRARDLAKIGQLILQNGKWNGEQLISESWIEQAMQGRITLKKTLLPWSYGYFWMQTDIPAGESNIHTWFVPGSDGQMLAVFPSLEMVVVFNAGNGQWETKNACFRMICQHIIPSLMTINE